jgi:hypothetical protein
MKKLVWALFSAARSSLKSRRELGLENLALRQLLAVLRRQAKRPKLSRADRAFWVVLARVWPEWRTALVIVQPATVIRWHRKGFALYWRWTSRKRGGRPRTDAEMRTLIREMARDNVGWGAPRIHGELLKLGFVVSEATVSRLIARRFQPPSQTWNTFLANHLPRAAPINCRVVPTATFRSLYANMFSVQDAVVGSRTFRRSPNRAPLRLTVGARRSGASDGVPGRRCFPRGRCRARARMTRGAGRARATRMPALSLLRGRWMRP